MISDKQYEEAINLCDQILSKFSSHLCSDYTETYPEGLGSVEKEEKILKWSLLSKKDSQECPQRTNLGEKRMWPSDDLSELSHLDRDVFALLNKAEALVCMERFQEALECIQR